jgi:hypothetical protein
MGDLGARQFGQLWDKFDRSAMDRFQEWYRQIAVPQPQRTSGAGRQQTGGDRMVLAIAHRGRLEDLPVVI